MTRKTGLSIVAAAVLAVAMAGDAQAFWGSRGSWGSCGSSGGSWGGSWGSGGSSGSWGSSGSHGGFLRRIFHGSHGSCGSNGGYSSCGSSGGSGGSAGSTGGAAYYGGGMYYAAARPAVTPAVATASTPAVKTLLTLRVPADAKVTLAGVPTKQTGEVRQYTTSKLADGQAWDNYQVVVEMERGGKVVREERTITLTGGASQELSIGPQSSTLAQVTR